MISIEEPHLTFQDIMKGDECYVKVESGQRSNFDKSPRSGSKYELMPRKLDNLTPKSRSREQQSLGIEETETRFHLRVPSS